MSKEAQDADFATSDPILYLDLGKAHLVTEKKKITADVQVFEESQKIITAQMLVDIESRIREGTRIAGSADVIEALKTALLQRNQGQGAHNLSKKDLDEQLKSVESINDNENGPQAARDAFKAATNTKVLVATFDPKKFNEQNNVEAFKFGDVQDFDQNWEIISERLDKAREEALIRNIGSGATIGGRDIGIEGLMGPPMKVDQLKKRYIDEYIRAIRDKGKESNADKIKAQIEGQKRDYVLQINGENISFRTTVWMPATDDNGKPIRDKQGDPILDIIQIENGRVRNIIINDPDGTRKEAEGGKVKWYKLVADSPLHETIGEVLSVSAVKELDFVSKEFHVELKKGLEGADEYPKAIEPNSVGKLEAWQPEVSLDDRVTQFFAHTVKGIEEDGVRVEYEKLPQYMKKESDLSPEERLTKFGEDLNSLTGEAKSDLVQGLNALNDNTLFKVDRNTEVSFDNNKFLLELTQIANEGMMLDRGLAGVVTRTRAMGEELNKKLSAQESDIHDMQIESRPLPSYVDKGFESKLPESVRTKATKAGRELAEIGVSYKPEVSDNKKPLEAQRLGGGSYLKRSSPKVERPVGAQERVNKPKSGN